MSARTDPYLQTVYRDEESAKRQYEDTVADGHRSDGRLVSHLQTLPPKEAVSPLSSYKLQLNHRLRLVICSVVSYLQRL